MWASSSSTSATAAIGSSTSSGSLSSSSWLSDTLQAVWNAPLEVWQAVKEQPATHALSDSVTGISDGFGSFLTNITGGQLVQKVEDKMDRVQASWRWRKRGGLYSQRLPLSRTVDDKALLASLSLAKAVHDHVTEHGESLDMLRYRPVTLALAAASVGLFMKDVAMRDVCLSPYAVIELGQWDRLFTAALLHLNTAHLLSNLASTVPDALYLERSSGSALAAVEFTTLTAAAHGTYVLWAWARRKVFNHKEEYYSVGALGLSSLAFALQVVAGERRSAGSNQVYVMLGPFKLPARFSWVLGLAISHLCSPEASFPGHLCGVAAGLVYVYGIEPVFHLLGIRPRGAAYTRWDSVSGPAQPRFYGAVPEMLTWKSYAYSQGTTSGRMIQTGFRPRAAWWKRWGLQLSAQLAAVAAASLLYVATRRKTKPINTWAFRSS